MDNDAMSMYVELLSNAPEGRLEELSGDALIGYTLICRAEMLEAAPHKGHSILSALATEVTYDRALIKLCADNGIEVAPASFAQPSQERRRLEMELAGAELDLVALARRPPR
jgi:hypothetical protein